MDTGYHLDIQLRYNFHQQICMVLCIGIQHCYILHKVCMDFHKSLVDKCIHSSQVNYGIRNSCHMQVVLCSYIHQHQHTENGIHHFISNFSSQIDVLFLKSFRLLGFYSPSLFFGHVCNLVYKRIHFFQDNCRQHNFLHLNMDSFRHKSRLYWISRIHHGMDHLICRRDIG